MSVRKPASPNAAKWIAALLEEGVELWAEGERLRYLAPQGVMTPALRRGLAERKSAVLDLLGQHRRHAAASFAQRRLWLHEQIVPGTAAYNVPVALRLRGPLASAALTTALQILQDRHDSLRTTFTVLRGKPFQVVADRGACDLPRIDLDHLPARAREPQARRLLTEEACRSFDLVRGPLLRALLVRLTSEEHLLLLTMHHAVTDGWSNVLIQRELWKLYDAVVHRRQEATPTPSFRYVDFSRRQHQQFADGEMKHHLRYWKRQVGNIPPVLDLPRDRPRPAVSTYRGKMLSRPLPDSLVRALRGLARGYKTSFFVIALAAFLTWLHRLTGQKDVLVGSFVANRNQEDVEPLVGFFVNTLALRGNLGGNPNFSELVGRARERFLEAHEHQDLPFEKLVEELQPERDLSRHPLFQVTFGKFEAPLPAVHPPQLDLRLYELTSCPARFDLDCHLMSVRGAVHFLVQYSSELFESTTILRFLDQYLHLLTDLAENPRQRLGELTLLGAPQRHQLLVEWNDQDLSTDSLCLHQLFQAQARRSGEAPAVFFEGRMLTYRELRTQVGRLAGRLRELGARPEVFVGIFLERSLELLVAVWGILEAGGAFVPLDPEDPEERLAFKLADSRVSLVVTQERLRQRLPGSAARIVTVDGVSPSARPGAFPTVRRSPDHPAYMIYTSGSTGRPKGVVNTQRAICSHLAWMQRTYDLDATDRVLHKTPTSFDVSVWELLWPFVTGAQLVVARPGGHRDSGYLAHLVVARGITTLHFVPSMLRVFLEDRRSVRCRSLRRVIASGETLSAELVRRFSDRLPGIELYNLYGPTEAAIDVTAHLCEGPPRHGKVLIGRPVANTSIQLLDEGLHPVPIGVAGELFIGGAQLARGYAARPGLTAERFVPDPVSRLAGERIYRTGDLAFYHTRGEIELLGRKDHQVKLRGHRIELGEVETVLEQHPAVRHAVVTLSEVWPRGPALVAYLVRRVAGEDGDEALRDQVLAWLRRKLPEVWIPSIVILLDELPSTPSGKVDRAALPPPSSAQGARPASRVPPRTPDEEILAEIWCQVLGLDEVSVYDHFFRLGGHSLLATQVMSRIGQVFRVDLPVRRLFETPVLAELTAAVTASRRSPGPAPPALERQAIDPAAVPLSFAQQRLWFLQQLSPRSFAYNFVAPLLLEGPLHVAALADSLRQIRSRHETLRTTFPDEDGRPRQAVAPPPARLELPVVDLTSLPEPWPLREARHRIEEETSRPFDLRKGPLFRPCLWRLAERRHVLALHLHHVVTDGWSQDVLNRELAALYGAALRGRPSPLPELPIRYADFAVWQRRWLTNRDEASRSPYEVQLAYYRRRLADLPPLALPTDRPRSASPGDERGAATCLRTPERVGDGIRELGAETGTSQFMIRLAALTALLHRITGQYDLAVGSPIANRHRREVEDLIGFFVNTLVLRVRLRGTASFADLLAQVREVSLGAYAHQDLPFEKLIEELGVERDLATSPLFQVFLVAETATGRHLSFSEVTARPLAIGFEGTKYDLTFTFNAHSLEESVRYRRALFDATTIRRLSGHFQNLLAGAVAEPALRLSELPLLGSGERHQLIHEEVRPPAPRSSRTLHGLFEARAAETPEAPALIFEGTRVTYGELNRQAELLARTLRRNGVVAEARVAICLERSPHSVAAQLAVLKAGGAYAFLDPKTPRARLRSQLQALAPRLLLTREPWTDLGSPDTPVLELPDALEGESAQDADPRTEALAEQAAYVTLTSGSTGRPQAVVMSHREAVTYLEFLVGLLRLGRDDVVLQVSPLSFDMVVRDLLGPLAAGSQVVLVPEQKAREPAEVLARITAHRVRGILGAVPAMLRSWLDFRGESTTLASLRWLVVGGESFPAPLSRRLLDAGSDRLQLLNHYGTSESYGATLLRIPRKPAGDRPLSIGRPRPGTVARLLGRSLTLVPLGVPGELAIGGAGLARGYLDQPRRTSEKFVPDPWSAQPGARLYRTGDLARYRHDGQLEILGRLDHQIKLRGFRIEPAEIEAALAGHPAIREAAVAMRTFATSDGTQERIVAWFVSHEEPPPSRVELYRFLTHLLPEPFVPGVFVSLEKLPRGARGKLDRQALRRPDLPAEDDPRLPRGSFVPPRDPIEETVAESWAEVLGIPVGEVGAHDDFFELGGHSLLATQVVARLQRFAGALTLRDLFETSTLAQLAAHLKELLAEGAEPLPPVAPASKEPAPPLSFAQRRMWFLDQLEPGSSIYNVKLAWRLDGALDDAALAGALRQVVARHEVLRTTYPVLDGQPSQRVAADAPIRLKTLDLTRLASATRHAEVRRRLDELARWPFDLGSGPLLRAFLLKVDTHRQLLLLGIHHIVFDGWSKGILYRELAVLYEAFSQGRASPLPGLAIQYSDFAAWQREWLLGETLERQLAYWRTQLADLATLRLPTDRRRAAAQSLKGAHQALRWSAETTAALHRLSLRQGTSLYMTLLAVLMALLHRWTGQSDVAVGSPIANRPREGLENLIGLFVNTLVLRAVVPARASWREWLASVREVALGAFAHQDLPFERLVDELQPKRDLTRHPLFQVFLALQNVPESPLDLRDLDVRPVTLEDPTPQFDLEVYFWKTGTLRCRILFDPHLFDATTVARLAGHLERLLAAVPTHEELRLVHLPLWSSAERHQVLVEWSGWGRPDAAGPGEKARQDPRDLVLTELFEARCRATPDAPAVIAPSSLDAPLTYRELNLRANRLARFLVARGVGPEVRVGLLHERSPDAVVAMLGILKAGGAYVPLDPAYPRERLEVMIEDAQASLLVTSDKALAKASLDRPKGQDVLVSEAAESSVEGWIAEDLPRRWSPTCTAYVIYTSGSTGRPKGVVVEHRSLSWYARAAVDHYALVPGDRILQAASISFDISVGEIFPALACGAAVVLAEPDAQPAISELFQHCKKAGVTVLFPATALWHEMATTVAVAPSEVPSSLRLVSFGGERVLPERVADWYRALGHGIRLTNGYGPTEGTVEATLYELISPRGGAGARALGAPGQEVPIGRPVSETRVYVLDRHLQAAPVGASGELVIAGQGLSRGYLGQPTLTAERFVPHPYARTPGERLYRSGDRARWRSDGHLELDGRLDPQLKVRGFRIEPEEIEAALLSCPALCMAAVVARETSHHAQLAAFVVAADGGKRPTLRELSAFLRQKLPDYMVPATISFVDALPLSPNGKIDRATLQRAATSRPETSPSEPPASPASPVEETLAGIWADVLHRDRVGLHESFFELGGDSILTIRIVALARREGLHFSPGDLFRHQTVAALAQVAGRESKRSTDPTPVSGPVPLTPIQHRFFEHGHPEPWHFNTAAFLQPSEPLDPTFLEPAIAHLLRHHDALRLRFTRQGRSYSQVNAGFEEPVPYTEVDLSQLTKARRQEALKKLSTILQTSLSLETGPLLRLVFFTTGFYRSDRLFLLIHHLVVDDVSWYVLLEDLATAYRQLAAQRAVVLPAKTTSFKEWAERLARHARTEESRCELDYWREQSRRTRPLPVDFKRHSVTVATSSGVRVSLGPKQTQALIRQLPVAYSTDVKNVLLSALALSLKQWTGATSFRVHLEGHGREEIFPDVDLSRTVGWLMSIYPVLLDITGVEGREATLEAVTDQMRRVPRRGLGYGLLRHLAGEEIVQELRAFPPAEILFNYLGHRDVQVATSLFRPSGPAIDSFRSRKTRASHLLEIHAVIDSGQLSTNWVFNRRLYRRETISRLTCSFLQEVDALIEHCFSSVPLRTGHKTSPPPPSP